MNIGFWKSRPGRPGTVSGALFFQQKKLKNDGFYKVWGVLRFHSFCIYFHKFSSLSFSPEYNKTNGFLYFLMVQRVSFRHHFPFIFSMFF